MQFNLTEYILNAHMAYLFNHDVDMQSNIIYMQNCFFSFLLWTQHYKNVIKIKGIYLQIAYNITFARENIMQM